MTILTIDIGIRHLSMCIMDCLDKNSLETFKIHLWETYNTLEMDNHFCNSLTKSEKICGKKCMYKYRNDTPQEIYTCKTHFPKEIPIKKENHYKRKLIKDYKLQEIAKTVISKVQEIYDNNLHLFGQLTQIVIELQPRFNPSMKFTSHVIYGKLVELCQNAEIKFVRGSQKLKAYKGPYLKCTLKGKYNQRKWLSVEYTRWFLKNKFNEEQQTWLKVLSGKADDKADTFLMAINVLTK